MSLKIKYLDHQNGSSKNKAIFLAKESKISDFRGIFDDKINQKILKFLRPAIFEIQPSSAKLPHNPTTELFSFIG